MSDSHKGGRWSIPEAENAVKAAFFVKAVDLGKVPELRYTDLQKSVTKGDRQISFRTLARALDHLEANGEVIRRRAGREVRYRLAERPPEEYVAIYANADSTAIEAASSVGAVGAFDEGWALYGFHPSLPRRLRSDFRKEIFRFREKAVDILDREVDRYIKSVSKMARPHLSPAEARSGQRALEHAFRQAWDAGALSAATVWVAEYLERVAPGSVKAVYDAITKSAPKDLRGFLEWVSQLRGEDFDEREIEREIEAEEAYRRASLRLFNVLSAGQRERAAREFGALVSLVAYWCVVIR